MKIAIATTTMYPSMIARAEAALAMLKEAYAHQYTAIVVDGGSCPEFLRGCLQYEPWVKVYDEKERGMGKSRRQAIRAASKLADLVWWTEEKPCLIHQLVTVGDKVKYRGADIVVPTRRSLDSYPEYQALAEIAGNEAFWGMTGHKLDMWSGPRLIDQRALPYFLEYEGDYGDLWDCIFVPVMRAIADGLMVLPCDVDYVHSREQTLEEERDPLMNERRRIKQLHNLLPAIAAEARKLGLPKK